MPAGKHTSVRVALSVPPTLHSQLEEWAGYEGRPVASLCLFLIEKSLREAQRDGIAPKYGSSIDNVEGVLEDAGVEPERGRKRFSEYYKDKLKESDVEPDEKSKKELLVQALVQALVD